MVVLMVRLLRGGSVCGSVVLEELCALRRQAPKRNLTQAERMVLVLLFQCALMLGYALLRYIVDLLGR